MSRMGACTTRQITSCAMANEITTDTSTGTPTTSATRVASGVRRRHSVTMTSTMNTGKSMAVSSPTTDAGR